MKHVTLIFILVLASSSAFSQFDTSKYNKILGALKKKSTILLKEPNKTNVMPGNRYNMPVVELKSQGTYRGNNGSGSDIYTYEPDNMPILKPDSTFRSSMPLQYAQKPKKNLMP